MKAAESNKVSLFKGSAFDYSSMPMMIIDRDFIVTYANSGTDKLFQDYAEEFKEAWPSFNPENIIGTCIDTFHKNPSHQRKMLSNPAILPFETDISIGALKFHLSVSGVFDREGEYVGNILQWDNVTAIRTNAGILQAIDRAQAVIEFLPNGQIVKANENFLKTLGYEASDIKGKHHRIFCHPSFAQSPEYKSFWEQLRAGEFITDKFRRVSKSGEDIWIEATYSPLVDSSGKVYKVIKIASDVTAAENARVKYEDDMAKKNASQELVVSELATGLRSLSDGNLTAAINIPFDQEYEGLRGDFNSALDKLTATMQKIMSTAANIQNGAVEMSQASDDLSKRTENQAAALEETAAALDEVTATVQQTAKAAEDAWGQSSSLQRRFHKLLESSTRLRFRLICWRLTPVLRRREPVRPGEDLLLSPLRLERWPSVHLMRRKTLKTLFQQVLNMCKRALVSWTKQVLLLISWLPRSPMLTRLCLKLLQ